MPPFMSSAPTHLSLFVTDSLNGAPVARLPLYAEVAVPRIVAVPPINERFREPMRAALLHVDPTATGAVRDRVEEAALQALSETIDDTTRNQLVTQPQRVKELCERMFKEVLRAANRAHMSEIPPAELKPRVIAALRRVGAELGLGLVPDVADAGVIWADPLGVLTTDHVGYASFDLRRLRPEVSVMLAEAIEARRNDPDAPAKLAIWVHPYGHAGKFDAFSQARFAFDAVVARFQVGPSPLTPAIQNMGPRSMHNPSLTDWRLSPSSFAASPKTLVGEDGCDELVPAHIALQEFVLRQVVRVTDPADALAVPEPYKFAYVDDYKVSWFSLGHSLGEILYSLPLAPAESVKLAVIDWSWDSLVKRDEQTKLTEEVLHQTHRDRTITETVKAGLKELQHGSSFMGGVATSAGATGTIGPIGAAIGNTWSLGGSTATSDGSRDLAAENVQRLSDSFSQASSAQRELNSTVVIQARQEEKESIQTRTFTNYNHSHTLTILYYEVLRHFRVTVEWVRRRLAVLAQLPPRVVTFDAATLIGHRFRLEAALLDPSLKGAFDALEKQETIREHQTLHGIAPSDNPVPQWWAGDIEFSLFEFGVKTAEGPTDDTDETVMVNLILVDGTTVSRPLVKAWEKHSVSDDVNVGNRFDYTPTGWFIAKPDQPVKWRHLMGFEFVLHDNDEWRMDRLTINGFHAGGKVSLLDDADVDYWFPLNGSSNTVTGIKPPGPVPAPLPPTRSPEKSLTPEERHQIDKLLDHFERHKEYYGHVIFLATDPTAIAIQFESAPWTPGQMLADHADPDPLDVFGSYVAYPLARKISPIDDTVVVDLAAALNGNDAARRQWAEARLAAMSDPVRKQVLERVALASAKSERLLTLPTRGVFAEGKLGHCNVSEEIDNTRFWKWEEHPIPIEAPDINPVTPIQPQPQAVSATPTAFPQSLVNIVNPSPAPDPTGLAAALTALATPNIFRDMSGRAEVADLLKRLSDNSIRIAEASAKARDILANQAAAGTGGGTAGGAGGGASGGAGARPGGGAGTAGGGPMPVDEQHDRIQLVRNAVTKGNLSAEKGDQKIDKILDAGLPPGTEGEITLAGNDAVARSFVPPSTMTMQQFADALLSGQPESGRTTISARYKASGEVVGDPYVRFTLSERPEGGSVKLIPGAREATVIALRPGLCTVLAEVTTGPAKGPAGGLELSVPLYVDVSGSAANLEAVAAAWHLTVVDMAEILGKVRFYAGHLTDAMNLRIVWRTVTSHSAAQVLPSQFEAGSEGQAYLTRITLARTSPSGAFVDIQTTASFPALAYNGVAAINLDHLADGTGRVGECVTALVGRLGSAAAPEPAVTEFTKYFIARTLASNIVRLVCGLVLGPSVAGAPSNFTELTGYELAQGANAAEPSAYVDRDWTAMQLRPATIKMLDEPFPVPPAFK